MTDGQKPAWKTATRLGILLGIVLFLGGLILGDLRFDTSVPTVFLGRVLQMAGAAISGGCVAVNYRLILNALSRDRAVRGAHTMAMAILAVILAGLICYISTRRYARLDWTGQRRFSLHSRTLRMLRHLKTPIDIAIVYRAPDKQAMQVNQRDRLLHWGYKQARRMLEEFEARSPEMNVRRVDLSDTEALNALTSRYDLPDRCIVFESEQAHDIIPLVELVRAGKGQNRAPEFLGEGAFASALIKLTQGREQTVYFLTGHGERPLEGTPSNEEVPGQINVLQTEKFSLSRLVSRLEDDQYRVKPLNLADTATVPEDCDTLVIAGPRSHMQDGEITALIGPNGAGKTTLLIMFDSRISDDARPPTNLQDLLSKYGVRVHTEAVGMTRRQQLRLTSKGLAKEPRSTTQVPVTAEGYANHPITRDLRNYTLVFARAAPVEVVTTQPEADIRTRELLTGAPSSWGETAETGKTARYDPESDLVRPVNLGAVVEPAPSSESPSPRIVVLGSSLSFVNQVTEQNEANLYVILNAVNWLAGKGHMVGIPPKTMNINTASLSEVQVRMVRWLFVVGLPVLVIALGTAVWMVRRR